MKILFSLIATLILIGSVGAAEPTKADFNILSNKVDNIQKQVDDLKAKVDNLHKKLTKEDFLAGRTDCDGCKCGCDKTGKCKCGVNCPCSCGCGITGQCNCSKGNSIPKIDKSYPANSYQKLFRHIQKGGKGVLYLGVSAPLKAEGIWAHTDNLGNFPHGIYDCYLDSNGGPFMQIRAQQMIDGCINGNCPLQTYPNCPNGMCPR